MSARMQFTAAAAVFAHLTDELYESKIVYCTQKYGDKVRTFCMNLKGAVVTENTNGIITVNGHSYEDTRFMVWKWMKTWSPNTKDFISSATAAVSLTLYHMHLQAVSM